MGGRVANLHQANFGFHDFFDSDCSISTCFVARSNSRQAHLAGSGLVCTEKARSQQETLRRLQISNDGCRCRETIARGRAFEPGEWPGLQSLARPANYADRKIP